jgi:8-oxo-dGTP diphosphatase
MLLVTAAVIEHNGRVLIARRRPEDRFGGVWEFPGGKLESGETPEAGLRREIDEELGLAIEIGEGLGSFPFTAEGRSIELIVFRAAWSGGSLILREHSEARWVAPADLPDYDFAGPDRPVVQILAGEAVHER